MAALDPTSYDFREVACPACGARAGAYCRRPSGHAGPFVEPHQQRRQVAVAAWKEEEITLYGKLISTWDGEGNIVTVPPTPLAGEAAAKPPASKAGEQLRLF